MEGTAPPDRNDEYLFYQLLLGAWPAELTGVAALDPDSVRAFAERLEKTMVKSVREAKAHSTWASPNAVYEDAMVGFIRVALDTSRANAFLDSFLPFQERVARLGVRNSLVQTALKLTLPGMPDVYQGAELWDLSLVDPDNRRAVDYELRDRMLTGTMSSMRNDRREAMLAMLEKWHDGRCKLAVTATLLAARREHPMLFAEGGYEPLIASGPKSDQICAFARVNHASALLVVAARFPVRIEMDPGWDGTEVAWPRSVNHAMHWHDLLTDQAAAFRGGEALPVCSVLGDMPVAVLVSDGKCRS